MIELSMVGGKYGFVIDFTFKGIMVEFIGATSCWFPLCRYCSRLVSARPAGMCTGGLPVLFTIH